MPAKSLRSLSHFQSGSIDLAILENIKIAHRPVVADDTHEPHRRKEGCRVREIDRRSANHILALAKWCLDRVNPNRTRHQQRHSYLTDFACGALPAPGSWRIFTREAVTV